MKVPYFKWRNGRPRWEPGGKGGAHLRANGFHGRDLKDEAGQWLGLEAAIAAAGEINRQVAEWRKGNAPPPIPKSPRRDPRGPRRGRNKTVIGCGYVYFLWSGEHIKVGFSTNPFTGRVSSLSTGMPDGVKAIVAVQGTLIEERRLHVALARWRVHGEWFRATPPVLHTMTQSMIMGRPALDTGGEGVPAARLRLGYRGVRLPRLRTGKNADTSDTRPN